MDALIPGSGIALDIAESLELVSLLEASKELRVSEANTIRTEIKEKQRSGTKKLNSDAIVRRATCSLCGRKGHNKRTCGR